MHKQICHCQHDQQGRGICPLPPRATTLYLLSPFQSQLLSSPSSLSHGQADCVLTLFKRGRRPAFEARLRFKLLRQTATPSCDAHQHQICSKFRITLTENGHVLFQAVKAVERLWNCQQLKLTCGPGSPGSVQQITVPVWLFSPQEPFRGSRNGPGHDYILLAWRLDQQLHSLWLQFFQYLQHLVV